MTCERVVILNDGIVSVFSETSDISVLLVACNANVSVSCRGRRGSALGPGASSRRTYRLICAWDCILVTCLIYA